MATKPELRRAVSNSKIKSSDWNFNFDSLNDYIENSIADSALTNYDVNTEYQKGAWVLAEVEGEKAIFESKYDGNKGNSLLDETYWDKVKLGGSSRNIGELVTSLLPQTDAGLHLVDGALINGNGAYADFVNYIAELYNADPTANYFTDEETWQTSVTNYGVCGKFVYDNVANTVRLPKVTGIIEGTIDVSALGDLVEAGLPNITGYVAGVASLADINSVSGALKYASQTNGDISATSSATYKRYTLKMDASLSNPIYKDNFNKVQPQTIKGFVYICIATSKKTDVEVNIDNVMTDVNGKADTDLTNLTNTGKEFASGLPMPSGRNIDLTLGATGAEYTAPANGWVTFTRALGDREHITMSSNDVAAVFVSYGSQVPTISIPVIKGAKFVVTYLGTGITYKFKFIYAEGAE